MAFDVTNPADLLTLKTEQATDPIGMGYAAVDGSTKRTLALFNDGELNVGGQTTGSLTVRGLCGAVDPDEMSAQQVDSGKLRYVHAMMGQPLSEDISEFLPQLLVVFDQGGANTTAALNAALRRLSRAEILFGDGTVISKTDWFAARDS